MKKKLKERNCSWTARRVCLVLWTLMVMALLLITATPKLALAQVTDTTIGTVTNIPLRIHISAASNMTTMIPLVDGRGLAFQWGWVASNTAAGRLFIAPSMDGTNPVTDARWILSGAANAMTNSVTGTNWSSLQLAGYRGLFITGESNAAADSIITNNFMRYRIQQF